MGLLFIYLPLLSPDYRINASIVNASNSQTNKYTQAINRGSTVRLVSSLSNGPRLCLRVRFDTLYNAQQGVVRAQSDVNYHFPNITRSMSIVALYRPIVEGSNCRIIYHYPDGQERRRRQDSYDLIPKRAYSLLNSVVYVKL